MSVQTPTYRCSEQYILATLNLYGARIDLIKDNLKRTSFIEPHFKWYFCHIPNQFFKLKKFEEKCPPFNNIIAEKNSNITLKFLQTAELLEMIASQSLYKRVHTYVSHLLKSPNPEFSFYFNEISHSLSYFQNQIEEFNEFSTSRARDFLKKAATLIEWANIIMRRIPTFKERKVIKKSFLPPSSSFVCKKVELSEITPHFRVKKYYFTAKVNYRKMRLFEIGYFLDQQRVSRTYRLWIITMEEKEFLRIRALEKMAKVYAPSIHNEIFNCKNVFKDIKYILYQIKLEARNNTHNQKNSCISAYRYNTSL